MCVSNAGTDQAAAAEEAPAAAPLTPPPTASGAPQDAPAAFAAQDGSANAEAPAEPATAEASAPVDTSVTDDDVKAAWLASSEAIYKVTLTQPATTKTALEVVAGAPAWTWTSLKGALSCGN